MKSFRLYLGEPTVEAPVPPASELSENERTALLEQFKPLAEHYHRRERVAQRGFFAFFIFFLLGWVVPESLGACFFSAGACSMLWTFYHSPATPDCPACHRNLGSDSGPYCPECGSRSLQPGGVIRRPRCTACGTALSHSKGGQRRYKVRACCHCGLMVDDKGL